jgi:hypothetical protein
MLTNSDVEHAVHGNGPSRRFDSKGLYLLLTPNGSKWWRFRYRFQGKDQRLALGAYPDVGLAEARKQRDAAREFLADGIDPAAIKREQKARERAQRLEAAASSRPVTRSARVRVSFALDGVVEIWKGRALVQLTLEEARAVRQLLTQLGG